MKKQSFNFKDLKGALTRKEMREVKGSGGPVECHSCRFQPNLAACCLAYSPCPLTCFDGGDNSICWQCTPD